MSGPGPEAFNAVVTYRGRPRFEDRGRMGGGGRDAKPGSQCLL